MRRRARCCCCARRGCFAACAPAASAPPPAAPGPATGATRRRDDPVDRRRRRLRRRLAHRCLQGASPRRSSPRIRRARGAQLGGSSQLAIQLINGAAPTSSPAPTRTRWTPPTRRRPGAAQQVFVRNRLMIIAPASNPAHVGSLQDLARPGIKARRRPGAVPIGATPAPCSTSASKDSTYGPDFQRTRRAQPSLA